MQSFRLAGVEPIGKRLLLQKRISHPGCRSSAAKVMKHIERVTVLGAGTMGSRIAAHLANAGIPTLLLDIAAAGAGIRARNQVAQAGLNAALRAKPAAFFDATCAEFVCVGNFEDHLPLIAESDWVIEAVVEDLESKRALLRKAEAVRRPTTVFTTNTSGLPVASIAGGFSDDFRRHWFGTHFFNPPRYLRLVEITPTPYADPAAVAAVAHFCDLHLGKNVVYTKDTPNFIANRIAAFTVLGIIRLMRQMELSIEEVDALTGKLLGWPRGGIFRTLDMAGLDIAARVMQNLPESRSQGCQAVPEFLQVMLERKWLGDKTGGGFYKKTQAAPGDDDRLVLDWKTLEYRARQRPQFPTLAMAGQVENTAQRLRLLFELDGGSKLDKPRRFLWSVLSDLWLYSADRLGEISDSVEEIDRAMRLGFNWELGPFELWDAVGVGTTVARMREEGRPIALNAERLLASGKKSWYADVPLSTSPLRADAAFQLGGGGSAGAGEVRIEPAPGSVAAGCVCSGRAYFDVKASEYRDIKIPAGFATVAMAKKANGVVRKNASASIVDLGDGIGCIEFHSKLNVIGPEMVQLVTEALQPGGPGDQFEAFVVTNDAPNFCAGANLVLLLMAIHDEEWDEIAQMVRAFQRMTQLVKLSPRPVVAAPFGLTLGGGAEISLHAAARQPHAELYMGLVEASVGLVPAGGGLKEMLLRALDMAAAARPGSRGESVELPATVKRVFETVAMAKVSASAAEARLHLFLNDGDRVTMNRDRLVTNAKLRALELARAGHTPPRPRLDIPAPGESILAMLKLGVHLMRQGEYISDHDCRLGIKIAEVLCGGADVTPGTLISEQYLLELECEAFLSLCGEKKTQERIQHMLKTGTPLRN
jgi:3-hydroxyacyl-CoA dehydrogenase